MYEHPRSNQHHILLLDVDPTLNTESKLSSRSSMHAFEYLGKLDLHVRCGELLTTEQKQKQWPTPGSNRRPWRY